MPYEIKQEKSYSQPPTAVYQAVLKAVAGLEGKVLRENPESGELEASFDKKVLGRILGDRTRMTARVNSGNGDASALMVEAYPVDAVGRKLMFGARKGVTQTVLAWFFAHVEHHLEKQE